MKKIYETPIVEMNVFENQDIITVSSQFDNLKLTNDGVGVNVLNF